MSLMDAIDSLATDTADGEPLVVTVTRRAAGAFDADGVWTPGPITTFTLDSAVVMPATGMQRVVGGRDMHSDEQGQHVDDVRAVCTNVELKTREPGTEPDLLTFQGATWIVVRIEEWTLGNETVYRAMLTRETRGAS